VKSLKTPAFLARDVGACPGFLALHGIVIGGELDAAYVFVLQKRRGTCLDQWRMELWEYGTVGFGEGKTVPHDQSKNEVPPLARERSG
jgi:hypothetical protein